MLKEGFGVEDFSKFVNKKFAKLPFSSYQRRSRQ
jgi:hypothetical protein